MSGFQNQMSEDEGKPHFMALNDGPAKQYLALVDYANGIIREQLDQVQLPIKNEKDCYYIDNYYYCAKYGVKTFKTVADVKKEYETNKTPLLSLFVAFKTIEELEEAGVVAKEIGADMKVVVIESRSQYPQYNKAETFATENGFDVVYMTSNSQQLADARQCSEKTGVDRLMECLHVCNWPWRAANCFPKSPLTSFIEPNRDEFRVEEDEAMDAMAADMLMMNLTGWMANRPQKDREEPVLPAPQHAERVHLSPDSPTTTEGTTRGDEDVSISVDIDLVCSKTNEESQQRSEKAAVPTTSAKNSKQASKNAKKKH